MDNYASLIHALAVCVAVLACALLMMGAAAVIGGGDTVARFAGLLMAGTVCAVWALAMQAIRAGIA